MSDTFNSHENRGLAPNQSINFSQVGSSFLARVKKEPNYDNDSSSLKPDVRGRNFGESSTMSNFCKDEVDTKPTNVKKEARDDNNINYNSSEPGPSHRPFFRWRKKRSHNRKNASSDDSIVDPNIPKIQIKWKNSEGNALFPNDSTTASTTSKKNKKSRKRKANQSSLDYPNNSKIKLDSRECKADEVPWNNWNNSEMKQQQYQPHQYRNPNSGEHICDPIFIKGMTFSKPKANEFEDIISIDEITNLVKPKLSSCDIKSVPETNIFCNVKEYEWEKLVENEFVNKIDKNMRRTVDSILLPEDECKRILNEVIKDLNNAFKNNKGENRWHWIGSYSNGLVCRDTVIEIYYECFPLKFVPQDLRHELRESLLRNESFKKTNQQEMSENEISLINIEHKNTGKQISVSFSTPLQINGFLLMKLFLSVNPILKYLITYVELLFKKYHIGTGCKDFSYIVFWLVAFFLQKKKLLPAVIDVRKEAAIVHYVSGWDCSLPEDYSYPTESVSLYSLLLGFFNFYEDFDFLNYVICPHLGRVLALSDIERLQFSADEFSLYLKQIRCPDQITFTRFFLNLQDPTDLSCNLGNKLCATSLNKLKVICHRLNELLPHYVAGIEQMGCLCQILPPSIDPDDHPYDFTKYALFYVNLEMLNEDCRKKLNQCHILEAIRKLMEFVFRLELKSLVITQNFTESVFDHHMKLVSGTTFPVMHFEYCSSEEKTWQSDFMKVIIPRNGDKKGSVQIYLRCEICLQENIVRVFGRSEFMFITYLCNNFDRLLRSILSQILLP